jgi:hypothetical protein
MCQIDRVIGQPIDSYCVLNDIVFIFTRNATIQIMTKPLSTNNQKVMAAKQHYVHPTYSSESGLDDIALIVTDPIEFDDFTVPACLWYNTTHLPYKFRKVVFDRTGID